MYNVKTLNKIAACGTDLLDRSKYTVGDDIDNPQAILVLLCTKWSLAMIYSLSQEPVQA
jgi:D-3-phosphoglycerate dehydrogenase